MAEKFAHPCGLEEYFTVYWQDCIYYKISAGKTIYSLSGQQNQVVECRVHIKVITDVLCTADSGLPGFPVDERQLPLQSFLESTLATVLRLECLVDGHQITDVFGRTTEDRNLRHSAVVASARYHVA